MKKLAWIILLFVVVSTLASCLGAKEVVVIEKLTPLQYGNKLSSSVQDLFTPKYTGDALFSSYDIYEKNGMGERTVEVSGKKQVVSYDYSRKSDDLSYVLDDYSYVNGTNTVFATYRSDTKQLMRYETLSEERNRAYQSSVNPDSSETEYLAYAKEIFLRYAGVSVEGWDVRIQTLWGEDQRRTDGFLNYSHENPRYNAEYEFTYSKTISGIERCDLMSLRITNVGEILAFDAENSDKAFAPFENAELDREKIENAVWVVFGSVRSMHYGITSSEISGIKLIAKDGSLWAHVRVVYQIDVAQGSLIYVIKVAEKK